MSKLHELPPNVDHLADTQQLPLQRSVRCHWHVKLGSGQATYIPDDDIVRVRRLAKKHNIPLEEIGFFHEGDDTGIQTVHTHDPHAVIRFGWGSTASLSPKGEWIVIGETLPVVAASEVPKP